LFGELAQQRLRRVLRLPERPLDVVDLLAVRPLAQIEIADDAGGPEVANLRDAAFGAAHRNPLVLGPCTKVELRHDVRAAHPRELRWLRHPLKLARARRLGSWRGERLRVAT